MVLTLLLLTLQTCVGRTGPLFKTWEQITRDLGHKVIDVAKIDIEGHEPSVLAELRHDIPLPRQVGHYLLLSMVRRSIAEHTAVASTHHGG